MVNLICNQCSKEFSVSPCFSNRKFCSPNCYRLSKGVTSEIVACKVCQKPIKSFFARPKQFCSKSCHRTAKNLTEQNPAFSRDISGEKNPMFGVKRDGANNPMFGRTRSLSPRWKGGKKIRKDGYVMVIAPSDHPYPSYERTPTLKYILEHRLVMENHLGRYLLPTEVVHHKDENPSNNKIENLQLFASQSEHIVHHGKQ